MGPNGARRVVLDAGALIAFERGNRRVRILVRRTLSRGQTVVVPAGVVAQVWRDGRRQAQLSSLLNHQLVDIKSMDETMAKAAGALCGRTNTSDVIDATVVLTARTHKAAVVTSDAADLRRLDPGAVLHEI